MHRNANKQDQLQTQILAESSIMKSKLTDIIGFPFKQQIVTKIIKRNSFL